MSKLAKSLYVLAVAALRSFFLRNMPSKSFPPSLSVWTRSADSFTLLAVSARWADYRTTTLIERAAVGVGTVVVGIELEAAVPIVLTWVWCAGRGLHTALDCVGTFLS